MALVTSVTSSWASGLPGRRATTDVDGVRTEAYRSTTDLIAGRAVIRGASDGLVTHPSGTAGSFMGVVLYNPLVDPKDQGSPVNELLIPAGYTPTSILRRGIVTVVPEVNVTQGQPVFYRHASPGSAPEALGAFRNDSDSGDATLIAGAVWKTSGSAGATAEIEINLP